jgi:hypothetical protein
MPRYFFNVYDGKDLPDNRGVMATVSFGVLVAAALWALGQVLFG